MILSGHAEDGPKDWSHCRRDFETRGSTLSHGHHEHHEHHEHHGNPWQPMATYGMPLLVSVYTLRHRRRLLVSPIKNRRDQDPILWSAKAALMLTYVDSSTLRYTVYSSHFIILLYFLFFCISWSIYQVLSSGHIRSIQTSTQHASSESNVWHGMAAWPVPSEAKAAPTLSGRS